MTPPAFDPGMLFGFYSQNQAVMAVDANTILLLAAMMMLVAMLRPIGVFEFCAIAVSEAERCGIREACITPRGWMRVGVPASLSGLAVASALYALFFDYFTARRAPARRGSRG